MSARQWATPGRIVTGLVSTAVIAAALATATGSQRAQSLGLTRHGELLTAQDAGAADAVATVAIAPGTAGQVLTVSDAGLPHWAAAAAGGAAQPTTYYASDGTTTAGTAGTSASTSGSGASSTITLTVPASPATATTTDSTENGPRWCSPSIAQSATRVVLYLRSTARSGFATGGWRWSSATLRRAGETPPANLYLGAAWSDASQWSAGNLRSGSNSATYYLGGIASTSPTEGTDRWVRVVWTLTDSVFRASLATGATTGAPRPSLWTARTTLSQEQPVSAWTLGSAGTGSLTICVGLETFGNNGGASSVTYSLALEVTS